MNKIYIDPVKIDRGLVKKAAQTIVKGGIVALPTETVYGLACRADQPKTVERLRALKNRSDDKPFSIAYPNVERVANDCFDVMPPFGYRLMERFMPGPLTLIYYTTEDRKVGVRVPSHVVAASILEEAGVPVCLPSANRSGEPEATSASDVERTLANDVDLIVEGGTAAYARASTVLDLTLKPFKVLREGVISENDIARVFIKKRIIFVCTGNSCRSPMAQFLLQKQLRQLPQAQERFEVLSAGVAAQDGVPPAPSVVNLLKEKDDIDARAFRSHRLTKPMALSADFIFTMEDAQSKYIIDTLPVVESRVFNIKKFLPADLEQDIPDPIGHPINVYEGVYRLLEQATAELIQWL